MADDTLAVTVTVDDDGVAVVGLSGELDIASAGTLSMIIEGLAARHPREIIIDAQELTYCDSSGLSQFIRAERLIGKMRIVNAGPMVRRILDASGLAESFGLQPD